MKIKNRFPRSATGLVLVSAITLLAVPVSLLFAQPNPDEQPRRQPPQDFQPGQRRQPGFQGGGQVGQFMPMLNRVLTEEQRTSLREVTEGQREQTREQEQKLRDARKQILEASLAEKFDEAAVRAKALEVGKLEAELTVLRAKALSQIKPPLTAEQIEKLKNPPPMDMGPGQGGPRQGLRPGNRPSAGPRDENDLPPRPQPNQ